MGPQDFQAAKNGRMDQVEREARSAQSAEPRVGQMCCKHSLLLAETVDQYCGARHIKQSSPERPGRMFAPHCTEENQRNARELEKAGCHGPLPAGKRHIKI